MIQCTVEKGKLLNFKILWLEIRNTEKLLKPTGVIGL